MDPFSLIAGTAGLLQGIAACVKLAKKHVGPSQLSVAEAESLSQTLSEFHMVMSNFRSYLELHDDDEVHMSSLGYLQPIIIRSQSAAEIIRDYLDSKPISKLLRGSKFDKELKPSLRLLEITRQHFNTVLLADSQKSLLNVHKRVKKLSEDLQGLRTTQLRTEKDNRYRDVRRWLGAELDNNRNSALHSEHLSTRHLGSGEWLLKHSDFQNWLNSTHEQASPNLWLKGSPAFGKSYLCSTAIDHIANEQKRVCVYYFYRFDDQVVVDSASNESGLYGVRLTAILVDQLLTHFQRQDSRVADHIAAYIETAEMNISSLTEVTRLLLEHGHRNSQEHGIISATDRISLYVFLDGFGESKSLKAVEKTWRLFSDLGKNSLVELKIWISSQDADGLRQLLGLDQTLVINADDHNKLDVNGYLEERLSNLGDETERNQEVDGKPFGQWALENLQEKSNGNFLYAKLMADKLTAGVFSVYDIKRLITSMIPNDLAELYRRIYLQYPEDQREYISLLFSIIAFARRPLHLDEIREAMTSELSGPAKALDPMRTPKNLHQLFAPLVKVEYDPNSPESPLHRLCHSTVKDFVTNNPNVLCTDARSQSEYAFTISPAKVGELGLRYLSRSRYSALQPVPKNFSYVPPSRQHDDAQQDALLTYCAKYWCHHLDDLEASPELQARLCDFLQSPNFQTLLQTQSLYVEHQFSQFWQISAMEAGIARSRFMFRRAFPKWLTVLQGLETTEDEAAETWEYSSCYRHFVSEWGYLLSQGTKTCTVDGCKKLAGDYFRGEVDRCLSGLLGPNNFMRNMKERYRSFMLTQNSFDYHLNKEFFIGEAISSSNLQFMVISSSNQDEIHLQTWDLSHPAPFEVVSTAVLPGSNIDFRSNAAKSVAFSSELGSFRFGNTILSTLDTTGTPILLDQTSSEQDVDRLSADLDQRQDIIIITSRDVRKQAKKISKKKLSLRMRKPGVSTSLADGSGSDGSGYSSSSSSSDDLNHEDLDDSGEENSAYEYYSDGSTELDTEDFGSDGLDKPSSSESEDTTSADESDDDIDTASENSDSDSGDEEKTQPRQKVVVNSSKLVGDKDEIEGDFFQPKSDRPRYPGTPGRFMDPRDQITARVAIYRVSTGPPERLFHYKHPIPTMLYHSPPLLHPTEPLAVWPLGGGEVLFADYEQNTYFIRAMTPTTPQTRQICVKPRFSPDGRHLHIASLEGQMESVSNRCTSAECRSSATKEFILSLLVTTHRLSEQKTTRSPPQLIHKAKITLGAVTGLSLAKLPFTFTWTADHLLFCPSGTQLKVFRFELFRPAQGMPAILVPQLPVMLPRSASCRQVHYLPRGDGMGDDRRGGIVLIGSYGGHFQIQLRHSNTRLLLLGMGSGELEAEDNPPLNYPCPAVGFFVDEDLGLGGWCAPSEEAVVTHAMQTINPFYEGRLVRKMEYFNTQDDVDLEGICDWCNGFLTFRPGK